MANLFATVNTNRQIIFPLEANLFASKKKYAKLRRVLKKGSFQILMDSAIPNNVKELIDILKKDYNDSLRELSRACGVSHQTLGNWSKGNAEREHLDQFIHWARKKLKISKASMFDLVHGKKK